MRALRFETFGDPSVLKVVDIEKPEIGAGEALVQVHAAGINPSDVKNVAGAMHQTRPPRTPGRDYAGVVVEGPAEWVGKRVWGASGQLGFVRDGSHAEFLVVPADTLSEKPAAMSMAQAASAGIPFVTAYVSVVKRAVAGSGETLLIVGGSGAVGSAAAQIGRWRGCRVIATARSTGDINPEWTKNVDVVVNLERDDLAKAVRSDTQGRGADAALNVVGGPTFRASLEALAVQGRMAVISAAAGREVTFDLMAFYRNQLSIFGVDTLKITDEQEAQILTELAPGFESGALSAGAIETVRLEDGPDAYARVDAGARNKIVFVMDE